MHIYQYVNIVPMSKGKAGIIAGIAVAVGMAVYYLASPLFIVTEVNEPIPTGGADEEYRKFVSMSEEEMARAASQMSEEKKQRIMYVAAQITRTVDENVAGMNQQELEEADVKVLRSGPFVGVRGHEAKGIAKILSVNGKEYLRFEEFMVTNGPDLHVYLTKGGDVHSGVHLGKLKGSKGNQNYSLPAIDSGKYDTAVVFCQPFQVVFGTALLR
jgi:hypothetical protein